METTTIIILLSAVSAMRIIAVFALQFLCQTLWAEKSVYSPMSNRLKWRGKEIRFYLWGVLIEAIIGYFLIKFSVLQFGDSIVLGGIALLAIFMFIIEPVYYLFHRLLHTKLLYKRFHRDHHHAVVPEPVSGFYFTFSERLAYTALFVVPLILVSSLGLLSLLVFLLYPAIFDVVNALGHTNAKIFSEEYRKSYWHFLFYSPEFHLDHHKYFHTNYSLFMPLWDKIFKTHRSYAISEDK